MIRFVFATLDFVIDKFGQVFLIEANSVPVGYADVRGERRSKFVQQLGASIAESFHPTSVYFVLPDIFDRLVNEHPMNDTLKLLSADPRYSGFVGSCAADALEVEWAFTQLGCRARIICHRDFAEVRDVADSLVFWMSKQQCPLQKATLVNDHFVKKIMDDKLLFTRIGVNLKRSRMPRCFTPTELQEPGTFPSWCVQKPRFGSGSADIYRHNAKSLRATEWNEKTTLVQEWIEPDTIAKDRFHYYYDVRVAAYSSPYCTPQIWFRLCSFPNNLETPYSDCWWLPTLGHMYSAKSATVNAWFHGRERDIALAVTKCSHEVLDVLRMLQTPTALQ